MRLVVGDVTVEGEALCHHGHRDDATQVIAGVTVLPVGLRWRDEN